jgi:two-component system sensor histidine kinase BarA
MVSHFSQKHNVSLNKVFYILLMSVLLVLQTTSFAVAKSPVELSQVSDATLITPYLAVYEPISANQSFNDFRAEKNRLPAKYSENINFGPVNNGLWFHGHIKNTTDIEKWVLSVRFAQLSDVQLYILEKGELFFEGRDGSLNKQSNYANPTFELNITKNQELEVYLYTKASSLSLLAPIYIQTEEVHSQTDQIDFLLWGGFYGTILILAMYAISFSFNYPKISNLLFFGHIAVILIWQVTWSGHQYLMDDGFAKLFKMLRPEELIVLLCISSTLFTFMVLPKSSYLAKMRPICLVLLGLEGLLLVLMLFPLMSVEWRFVLTYVSGFLCLILNLTVALQAFKNQFKPARPLLIGWTVMFIGATLSTLYVFGFLPTNVFNSQLFQLALNIQAGAFLLSIVSSTQNELEIDLVQARADAENNFMQIEEQSVHLDIARREAIKASDVKSQFLANMSHEIRTPLNAIIGFSKELESKANPTERDEHVKIINSAASDLLTLVNDILDFSKMEAGQLTLNNKVFKPIDLFEDIAAAMSKTAHLKQLEFLYDIDEMPHYLIGDIFRLKQLITNLISNALKFTNYGYIALRARVLSCSDNECVLSIIVEDSGIGISAADIETIFKAFHQLDDELNRSYQGTGLGLVICQEIVYLMNGEIDVKSQPSEGSKFQCTIPFKLPESSNEHYLSMPFTGRQAVVYDTWSESRLTIVRQLQQLGFQVSSFESLKSVGVHANKNTYLFVTMPLKHANKRPQIVKELAAIATAQTVLLFSGPPPPSPLLSVLPMSTKVLRLPLTARKLSTFESQSNVEQHSSSERQLRQLPSIRMLAVDDMKLNLRLLETWLKSSPITLDVAYDGPSAISKCKHMEYDIILMDIQMPNMDGIETTQHIRKIPLNMGTPIIAVTAHALEQEKQHFLQSGLEDFLSKPIEIDNLVNLVHEWCDTHNEQGNKLPESIDWELALNRSNHNPEVAISFMDDFIAQLEGHQAEIRQVAEQNDVQAILASVHKLHGACCYTGVPRLQTMCSAIQETLKSTSTSTYTFSIQELLVEIKLLRSEWPTRRQRLL